MLGGDISNLSTPRMWVLEDVVLHREDVLVLGQKRRWWSRKPETQSSEAVVVQPAPMSLLWRFHQRWESSGMKIELIHIGAPQEGILDLLDRSAASAFSDVLDFLTLEAVADHLAFRPDVMFVVDVEERALRWGSRGMKIMDVRV